jgi:hypothetical protein
MTKKFIGIEQRRDKIGRLYHVKVIDTMTECVVRSSNGVKISKDEYNDILEKGHREGFVWYRLDEETGLVSFKIKE